MFSKILHANDGSEPAFHALSVVLAIAQQNNSELLGFLRASSAAREAAE